MPTDAREERKAQFHDFYITNLGELLGDPDGETDLYVMARNFFMAVEGFSGEIIESVWVADKVLVWFTKTYLVKTDTFTRDSAIHLLPWTSLRRLSASPMPIPGRMTGYFATLKLIFEDGESVELTNLKVTDMDAFRGSFGCVLAYIQGKLKVSDGL